MCKINFENIIIQKVEYKNLKLYVYYRHKNFKKCLILKNVKSFKSVFSEMYYYDSLLEKLNFNGFFKMINKNKKDNELYLIDGMWMRYIIKFNNEK